MRLVGGQSIQADYIFRGLQHETAVAMSFQAIDPALPRVLSSLQRIRYVRTGVTFPLYCVQLFFSVLRCDVLHIFSASYCSFVLATTPAVFLGRLFGKKVVVNYHSGEAEDHLRRWPSAVRMLRRAHSLVVPSPYLVRVLAQFGLRATAIGNAIDLQSFRFRQRRELRPAFLANRNFEALYNVAGVLRAFAMIQRERPDAILTVAGDGAQRDALHDLARQLQLRNVQFVGRVAPEDMPALYDRHDLWLNASDVDNMPLSILEAFASGVAVVSTNPGGIPDIVEHGRTGMLSACGDERALAQNALALLHQPALAQQLTSNGKAESEKYTWAPIRRQWLALYAQLLDPVAPES